MEKKINEYNAIWNCADEKGTVTIENHELFNYVIKQIRKYEESEDFKNYVINTLGVDDDYRTYNSLLVEDYLSQFLESKENDIDAKKMVFKFLKKYMFKGLYAVEGIKYDMLFILIEDDEDKILDKLYLGEINENEYQAIHKKESINDYKLVDLIIPIDIYIKYCIKDIEDMNFINEITKYKGTEYLVSNAIDYDEDESTVLLIFDNNKNIIDKIYY